MLMTFTASVRDGLSNLAASLGAGKDKASADCFVFRDLDRAQIEAMYRGDWLARKVVDIVPADMCREWRQWSGHRADVVRMEAAERRLGLRRAVQRALVLGRLYGGAAIVIGTGESDPAALARPLDPADVPFGGLKFLHVVNRWELSAPGLDRDPLSPWYGEATAYEVVAPGRGSLVLHPSRVVRFLGNAAPDPSLAGTVWSDSVLLALYDAIHAVALTMAGATSLMHEAKVDIVTVPNLSEHLSSSETTAQLSARFGYAAAMKSINNLLLLGDGETWNRQRIDFAGLPEMVKTFLQVAAGAADIPVTRLLGQSPAGLSATGDSDTRNYYDMVSARQEADLRPTLERLDRLIAASEGIDPAALTFDFRPLWQLDAATAATVALQKAQATQIYAGLNLWPAAVTARLVESQLAADGTYPNAVAVFGEGGDNTAAVPTLDFDPDQPRDGHGRWTAGGTSGGGSPIATSLGVVSPSGGESSAALVPALNRNESLPSTAILGPDAASQLIELAAVKRPSDVAAGQQNPESDGPGQGAPSTSTEAEADPDAVAIMRLFLGPPLALLAVRQRAIQAVRSLVQQLPSWLGGLPPDPPPSGEPATAGGGQSGTAAVPLSRPLTIPGGARPPDPGGEQYSLSEQGGNPPDDDSGRKPVWDLDIPSGLTIPVKSGIPREEGIDYEGKVRTELHFNSAPSDYELGGKMPDGVTIGPNSDDEIALEVKYLSASERPLRDPDRHLEFAFSPDLAQARKYLGAYKGGLLWVTNDANLTAKYREEFKS